MVASVTRLIWRSIRVQSVPSCFIRLSLLSPFVCVQAARSIVAHRPHLCPTGLQRMPERFSSYGLVEAQASNDCQQLFSNSVHGGQPSCPISSSCPISPSPLSRLLMSIEHSSSSVSHQPTCAQVSLGLQRMPPVPFFVWVQSDVGVQRVPPAAVLLRFIGAAQIPCVHSAPSPIPAT